MKTNTKTTLNLPRFTIEDIKLWIPHRSPGTYLPKNWEGNALDLLRLEGVPADDCLLSVLREECVEARTLRLFSAWCAREALQLVKNPDPRSIAACVVAERYANGQVTDEELYGARRAAKCAVIDAYKALASAADCEKTSFCVAHAASLSALWATAENVLFDVIWYAAGIAAWESAWAAAKTDAVNVGWCAAWEAARVAQRAQLVKLLTERMGE